MYTLHFGGDRRPVTSAEIVTRLDALGLVPS